MNFQDENLSLFTLSCGPTPGIHQVYIGMGKLQGILNSIFYLITGGKPFWFGWSFLGIFRVFHMFCTSQFFDRPFLVS